MRSLSQAIWYSTLVATCCGCQPSLGTRDMEQARRGSSPVAATGAAADIAVASSYLAVAARDLLGDDLPLLLLAEPGMCPGHFDLRPSQSRQLRACGLLVRFDFQSSLDARVVPTATNSPRVIVVTVPGGMCEPASYLATCRQLAESFVTERRLSREDAQRRLAVISARMDQLTTWARQQVADASLGGLPVLSSGHQAAFCRLLGLNVIAPFSAADAAPLRQIDEAVTAGEQAEVRLIIANFPEGRQAADALADRLGSVVVVFGNFPDRDGARAFDELVHRNVEVLVEAMQP